MIVGGFIALAALFAVLWQTSSDEARSMVLGAVGLAPKAPAAAKSKPICSQVIVPAGDCIPQHLANLPPDPGPAGKLTLAGIDADNDGLRDDVQRYIAEKYGHSERAVKALTLVAKNSQKRVELGATVTKDEAYEIALAQRNVARCYIRSAGDSIIREDAAKHLSRKVTNTPERFKSYDRFDSLLANRFFPATDATVEEACGYNPAILPN